MSKIQYYISKKEIKDILICEKTMNSKSIDYMLDIKSKLKLKKNRPPFMSLSLELDDGFEIKLQCNPTPGFETYSAVLLSGNHDKQLICRLDFHDSHRRKCLTEKFSDKYYEELHLHVYCEDCIKQKLKSDSMVFNISTDKVANNKFECFIKAFFDIINLRSTGFPCGKTLELEWT